MTAVGAYKFGPLLRDFRIKAGLRMLDVAHVANVSIAFISEIERGKRHVKHWPRLRIENVMKLLGDEQGHLIRAAAMDRLQGLFVNDEVCIRWSPPGKGGRF